jgi:hypothetical protein
VIYIRSQKSQTMNNQRSKNNATAIVLLLLLVCAIGGIAGCICFGQDMIRFEHYNGTGSFETTVMDSGLNGGAIGCGIFGAAALYGFVKVFLERTR